MVSYNKLELSNRVSDYPCPAHFPPTLPPITLFPPRSVIGIRDVQHPIALADAIRTHTDHAMFAGRGASRIARTLGFDAIDPDTLVTAHGREEWEHYKKYGQVVGDLFRAGGSEADASVAAGESGDNDAGGATSQSSHLYAGKQVPVLSPSPSPPHQSGHDTVGCVVWEDGRCAAATSTGGITAKKEGRVGDTAIVGSGGYVFIRVDVYVNWRGLTRGGASRQHTNYFRLQPPF